jgi:hypothetical protein
MAGTWTTSGADNATGIRPRGLHAQRTERAGSSVRGCPAPMRHDCYRPPAPGPRPSCWSPGGGRPTQSSPWRRSGGPGVDRRASRPGGSRVVSSIFELRLTSGGGLHHDICSSFRYGDRTPVAGTRTPRGSGPEPGRCRRALLPRRFGVASERASPFADLTASAKDLRRPCPGRRGRPR